MSVQHLTIAVTGAAGQVGSAVVRAALSQGHTVVGLDVTREGSIQPHDRYTYKQVNTIDFEEYKAAVTGCDAIIHLAAQMQRAKDAEGNRKILSTQHVSLRPFPPSEDGLFRSHRSGRAQINNLRRRCTTIPWRCPSTL